MRCCTILLQKSWLLLSLDHNVALDISLQNNSYLYEKVILSCSLYDASKVLMVGSFDDQHSGSSEDSHRKSEGRLIYYNVVDDDGNINEAKEASFVFKGHGLEGLSQRLEEETGVEDIIICSRNIVNGKLYPLRLALPPNNATMHVVVVPPTSTGSYIQFNSYVITAGIIYYA